MMTDSYVQCNSYNTSVFVQTLESPGSKPLTFADVESPGKGIGPGKPLKSPGVIK